MSALHCVVVWEWFDGSDWIPYNPAVTQHLERAHAKRLTRIILGDADPSLGGCYVNLRTRTQCVDGEDDERGVRRTCRPVNGPAGRGARWEWCSPGRRDRWDALPMDVQCRIEEAWAGGERGIALARERALNCPWTVDFGSLKATGPQGAQRTVRRIQQAPYPLTKAPGAPDTPDPERHSIQGRRTSVPHQHTGSSVKSAKSTASTVSGKSAQSQNGSIANRAPAKLPPKECKNQNERDKVKPNLARQILHNLNIFSNSKTSPPSPSDPRNGTQNGPPPNRQASKKDSVLDMDSSSTRSGRRPSVDTISTYLSHESKDSLNRQSVGDLLDCSAGSDDVFEPDPPPGRASRPKTPSGGSIVGVDAASSVISGFVRVVEAVQWGAVCPPCLAPLAPPQPGAQSPIHASHPPRVVVALSLCSHMMHLECLNKMLMKQQRTNKGALYIQCPVCSKVYGEMRGNQPPGTMVWCLQSHPLPGQTTSTHTIQITYNVVSGVQSAEHPSPGRPYYAVGFPRHCYLPDSQQGRRVLNLLSIAWERRLVFTVGRSVTTGREDVVTWGGIEHRTERSQFLNLQETAQFLERVIRQLNMRGVSDGQDEQGLYQELS